MGFWDWERWESLGFQWGFGEWEFLKFQLFFLRVENVGNSRRVFGLGMLGIPGIPAGFGVENSRNFSDFLGMGMLGIPVGFGMGILKISGEFWGWKCWEFQEF